ncbi:MAG TPA: DoxX family protein [Vicinamibacterales bacterium]|nr:DoxX family protein [Vicinamibacterales bacterium]
MAVDRPRLALTVLRVCIGAFFVAEGVMKASWFMDTTILARQLDDWSKAATTGSMSRWYLDHIALHGVSYFARLVPLGEIASGAALIIGFWTPLFAFIAFFMALNFQIASGAVAKLSFLTSGYGLPVLGSTIALVIGSQMKGQVRRPRAMGAAGLPRGRP